jgi:hypothetical protein
MKMITDRNEPDLERINERVTLIETYLFGPQRRPPSSRSLFLAFRDVEKRLEHVETQFAARADVNDLKTDVDELKKILAQIRDIIQGGSLAADK